MIVRQSAPSMQSGFDVHGAPLTYAECLQHTRDGSEVFGANTSVSYEMYNKVVLCEKVAWHKATLLELNSLYLTSLDLTSLKADLAQGQP